MTRKIIEFFRDFVGVMVFYWLFVLQVQRYAGTEEKD